MSLQASDAVMREPHPPKPGPRVMLFVLASIADQYHRSWPGQPMLARFCSVDERTIRRWSDELEAAGLLCRDLGYVDRRRVFHPGNLGNHYVYWLHLAGETCHRCSHDRTADKLSALAGPDGQANAASTNGPGPLAQAPDGAPTDRSDDSSAHGAPTPRGPQDAPQRGAETPDNLSAPHPGRAVRGERAERPGGADTAVRGERTHVSAESIKEVETSSSSARATTTVEDEDGQVADVLERLRRDRHLARLVDGAPAQVAKAVAARLDDGWDPARLATTVLAAHDWPAARGAGLLLTALAGLGAPPTRAMRPHHPDPTCPGCAGTGWRLEPGDPSAAAEPCPDCRTTRTDAA